MTSRTLKILKMSLEDQNPDSVQHKEEKIEKLPAMSENPNLKIGKYFIRNKLIFVCLFLGS